MISRPKKFFLSLLGVPLTRRWCAFVRVGVFRGTLRSRAPVLAMLRPSHRPALRFRRTPSTSRRFNPLWPPDSDTHTPHLPEKTTPIRLAALCIGLCVIASCIRIHIPPDVLPPQTMASLMADLHLLEGRRMGDKVLYAENVHMADYYAAIFQKHGISPDQYKRAHHFYSQYPELFSAIYDQVIEILQQRQIESENIPRNNTPPQPSDDNF